MNQQHLSSARQQIHSSPDAPSPGQRVLAIDAILDVIFSFSTPRTIISLSKTCRAARPIAASYFRVAYKPEHLLQQFLPDVASVCSFRSLQAQTGVTVFGKAAFNFLARAQLTENATMSLYVDASYAPLVNRFLTEAGYDVETREHELVFFRMGEGEQVAREVVLHVGSPDSFDAVDKPRKLSSDFIDVITFDGAYSLFPAQYDEEPIGEPRPPAKLPLGEMKETIRSFSDRASWVVTFEQSRAVPPQLAFGTSMPARDPLYTSSFLVSSPKGRSIEEYHDIQLYGVVLRSRPLRLTHIMCCPELSQFVQQFLTRLVIAHPERSSSFFDAEVAQFLCACFELVDVRDGLATYSAVWAIMKEMAPLPSDTPGAGGLQWPCRT